MNLKIYTDGGSRGNPGDAGIGIVVYSGDKVIHDHSEFIGQATNNEAEYIGLTRAIEWLSENHQDVEQVEFILDSKLVVEQINRNWKIKEPRMREYAQEIWKILEKMSLKTSFSHVKREFNKEADALVNQALDAHQL